MPKGEFLGEFELYVLAAVEQLGDEAYSVPVRQEIERRARRETSIGAVYVTVERLALKGYLTFRISDPEPVPGGRSRKYIKVTGAGRRAMRESVLALHRMIDGLGVVKG
ncbi:MAG: helix-turn-helix transcriptional regulator [Gemmatimonadaceae bacterium]